ncbi:MAG: hypothetical protein J6Q65_00605, partial [Lentisphaeria bacterium]|nr:hypothetical protein [Lentisphaeria bacterium]
DECKRNGWEKGIYLLEVTFDDLESNRTVFIPACVPAEEMKSIGGKMDTKRFLSDLAASESTDTGDHTTWTRIVVGNGDKINDVIYYDGTGRNNAVFSRMEDTLESFINTIPGSELMAPMKQVLEEADRAFTSATRFYGERHVNPKAFYQALNDYKEAARRYESFSPPPEKLTEARSKINELQKFLKDTHDSALNRMRAAANKKDYDAAHRICVEAMEYFEPGTDAYNRLKENKLKIEDAQRKIMKGK